MKFGKQFELYKIPEWLEYYFDYKGLKLVLKFLDNRPVKRKKLKALQMIKRNYERKYTLNVPKIQKLNRRVSSITNDSFASIEVPVNTFESKKAKLKRKRIMEAEDLSLLPNEEKLSRFIIIYKEKLKVIDDFFKMKLEEYSSELKNLENKMNLMENPSNDESV